MPKLSKIFESCLKLTLASIALFVEVAEFWWRSYINFLWEPSQEDKLRMQLKTAQNYDEWLRAALTLDESLGNNVWKSNPVSRYYDYKLIHTRLEHLIGVRENDDVQAMMYYLRSGLLRNLGGLHDPRLYRHSYVGTKRLIEEYISELVLELAIIANSDPSKLSVQAKMDFFNDTQQSFGRTALILQGGTTFGLYHLGVVKALHEHKLLPKILCGTGIGALIATLVCIHTDEELPDICKPGGIDLQAFAKVEAKGNIRRKINRLMKHGYLLDVKVLEDCVRSNVGDITFEDAFNKTGRILNIAVSPTRKYEVPQLLNYLTAPNVLIWSAACASTVMMGLYDSVELMAKDKNGKIVPWNPSAIKWSEASLNESESHTTRLTELFHVNHFIVSQANPYIVPFISRGLKEPGGILTKVMRIIMTEARHRLIQLEQFNLLPRVFRGLIDIKLSGNVTIVPSLSISDFNTLFSNPTYNALDYWIRKGESSAWPMISQIRNRCLVELELNKFWTELKSRALYRSINPTPPEFGIKIRKRTKSIH